MVVAAGVYESLARLFAYPEADHAEAATECADGIGAALPGLSERARSCAAVLSGHDAAEVEELYTTTFDLNPACCPEVGWHLFGERYDRGSFMVWARGELRRYGITESHELPDHLSHLMALLGRMDRAEATRFATEAVGPALERMIASVPDDSNPYAHLLRLTRDVLSADFGPPKWRDVDGNWDLRAERHPSSEDGE